VVLALRKIWRSFMSKFKSGDKVICKDSPAVRNWAYWIDDMQPFLGEELTVRTYHKVCTDAVHCTVRNKRGFSVSYYFPEFGLRLNAISSKEDMEALYG
jgi:hypothetical protein